MAIVTADDFNRANENLNASANWQTMHDASGTAIVSSNAARGGSSGWHGCLWVNPLGDNDHGVQFQLATKPANNNGLDLYLRISDTGGAPTGYAVELVPRTGTDEINFYRINGASYTSIGSASREFSSGEWFRATIEGTTLSAYYSTDGISWTLISSVTSSTYSTGEYVGFEIEDNVGILDNFGAGDLSVAGGAAGPLVNNKPIKQLVGGALAR